MAELPPLLAPRTPAAMAGMCAALVNAALRVALVPLFVTPLIDRVIGRQELEALAPLLAVAATLVIVGSAALWAQDALLARAAARVAAAWRSALYRRLLGRRPGTLPGTSGGLAARVVHDLREVETYYHYGLGTLVAESAAVIGILAVLAATSWQATLLLLVLLLPLLATLRLVGSRLERTAARSQEMTEELSAHLQEGLRHHEAVRAFGATEFVVDRFEEPNRRAAAAMIRRYAIAAAQVPITQVLSLLAVGGLVAVLAANAAAGAVTIGEMVAFITLVALLSTPAQLLPRAVAMAQQARAAAARLRLLATGDGTAPTGGHAAETGAWRAAGGSCRLELLEVEAGYGGDPLLRGVSLRLDGPGLAVIVGESGSGKTTLLRLLLGFHPARNGTVKLHDRSLDAWSESALRREVAYVPQGHELLRASIRENLTLGRAVADEDLWAALEEVSLARVVATLPGALDHRLGEDGGGLSGGQRQRIAVARALLGGPSLLLLDEPTSNLDEAAENELVAVLRRQARSRLVLAVAHRPALAEAADHLFRLTEGRLEPLPAPLSA